jgi:hypothetical protein
MPSPSQCKGTGPLLAGAKEAGEPARAGEDRFGFGLSHFDWQEFFWFFFSKKDGFLLRRKAWVKTHATDLPSLS